MKALGFCTSLVLAAIPGWMGAPCADAGDPAWIYGGTAVSTGPSGAFDEKWVYAPCVLFDPSGPGARWKMWYAGSPVGDDSSAIGYAESSDGVTWTNHPTNPIIDLSNHNGYPRVIKYDGVYHMWYHRSPTDGWVGSRIFHATSSDGISWASHQELEFGGFARDGQQNASVLLRPDGVLEMWFLAIDARGTYHEMFHSMSAVGSETTWEYPTLVNQPYSNPQGGVVLLSAETYEMWLTVRAPYRVQHLASIDGLSWTNLGVVTVDCDGTMVTEIAHAYVKECEDGSRTIWFHEIESDNIGFARMTQPTSLEAIVDLAPDTLNRSSHGRFVTCYITLPAGFHPAGIDPATIAIVAIGTDGGTDDIIEPPLAISPEFTPVIGDYDEDGIPDLTVKFDRQAVIDIPLCLGDRTITVRGSTTAGRTFEGADTIRVIDRGK